MSPNNDKMTKPIHSYYFKLMKEIDDAEWLGDFERADFIKEEASLVDDRIKAGDIRWALF
jgi:hypothetical protein